MKYPVPPGQPKEMYGRVQERLDPLVHGSVGWKIFFRLVERPGDKQRPADDVFFGNKPPETAIVAIVAIIAHGEIVIGWNHNVPITYALRQNLWPVRCGVCVIRAHGRKLISI